MSCGQPWVTSGGPLNATAASTWTALAACYNPLAALFTVFLVLSLLSDNLFCVLSLVMPGLLSEVHLFLVVYLANFASRIAIYNI